MRKPNGWRRGCLPAIDCDTVGYAGQAARNGPGNTDIEANDAIRAENAIRRTLVLLVR